MKNLISIILLLIPMVVFSQYYDVTIDNYSSYDVNIVIQETDHCSPYVSTGTNIKSLLQGNSILITSTTQYMYKIIICTGTMSCYGSCGNAQAILGHDISIYSDSFEDCSTGDEMDVVWQTHVSCQDILVTITDK